MDSAKITPVIGRHPGKVLFAAAAVAVLGVALAASARLGAAGPVAPSPAASVARDVDQPYPDVQLASQQAAFAMSHLGAMRDESELEPRAPATEAAPEKARAVAQRPAAAPRPTGQVAAAPLPPLSSLPARPAQPAKPESKPAPTIFGVTLPSPGKWVDSVASLGDSLTSLVRWR